MSVKLAGLLKRLTIVERAVAETAERERLAKCNCYKGYCRPMCILPWGTDHFEAEMNEECPVHGFRDLGQIRTIRFVNVDGPCPAPELDAVLAEYARRKFQYSRAKLENAAQEA